MELNENIGKVEKSLFLIYSFLGNKTISVKFVHFFKLSATIHLTILDTILQDNYLVNSKLVYERILNYRVLSIIIITCLDESKAYLNPDFQKEMSDNGLLDSLDRLKICNKKLALFDKENGSYFRGIRNLTMAHKGSGIVKAIEEIIMIDNVVFSMKLIEFLKVLKLFYDEINLTTKSILALVKNPI